MRTVLIFSGFLTYTFTLGALLSPWAYDLIQLGKGSQSLWGVFDYLANQPFGKISNRCFMIIAAIGIYPTFKAINCFNKKELGYDTSRKDFFKEMGKGLSFGLISLLVLATLLIVLNIRYIESDASMGKLTKAIFKILPGAIIIGVLEETLFRGIILNSMSRTLKPLKAVLISSFIFATIHFLRNKTDGDFSNPQWYTGFSYLFTTLQNYTNPEFLGSYLTLFTCGAFLSLVSLHYGNIARCIGIHCGWVIVISGLKKVTDDTPDEDTPYWWMIGNYDKVTGYLAFAIIALFCFSYWFLLMRNKTTENEIE